MDDAMAVNVVPWVQNSRGLGKKKGYKSDHTGECYGITNNTIWCKNGCASKPMDLYETSFEWYPASGILSGAVLGSGEALRAYQTRDPHLTGGEKCKGCAKNDPKSWVFRFMVRE
jgi:hypothetical protein